MARTRWPLILRTLASCSGQADQERHRRWVPRITWARPTGRIEGQPEGVSRIAGQAGPRPPTLLPEQVKPWEAGPEPSIPILPAEYESRALRLNALSSARISAGSEWPPGVRRRALRVTAPRAGDRQAVSLLFPACRQNGPSRRPPAAA